MSKNIKLFGASGCGNVGDDLIGIVAVKYLQDHLPNATISLVQQHHRHEIATSDIVIVGGGGLIYDYEMENVRNYCDIIHAAHALRIPTYLVGMGVQHVFSQEAKNIYTDAFKLVSRIATRGERDSAFIQNELSYPDTRLTTSRDLVFLYDDVFGEQPVYTFKITTGKPRLALSLADWRLGDNYEKIQPELKQQYEAYRIYITKNLPKLAKEFDVKVVCQAQEDVELSRMIVDMVENAELITFDTVEASKELVNVYRAVDYVVTNRYHGLIAAIIADKPILGVAFSAHKQKYLIDESFPSLEKQFMTVKDFVIKDIFGKLQKEDFRSSLASASRAEYRRCVALARRHSEVVRNIAADLTKMG